VPPPWIQKGIYGFRSRPRSPMCTTLQAINSTRSSFAALASSRPPAFSSHAIAASSQRQGVTRLTRAAEVGTEGPLHQLSDWAEIEIQVLRLKAELLRQIPHRLFETHERQPDGLRFFRGQSFRLHPADRLTLQNLAD